MYQDKCNYFTDKDQTNIEVKVIKNIVFTNNNLQIKSVQGLQITKSRINNLNWSNRYKQNFIKQIKVNFTQVITPIQRIDKQKINYVDDIYIKQRKVQEKTKLVYINKGRR